VGQIKLADRLLERLKVASLPEFMVLPVTASVVLTEVVVTALSLILKGEVAGDYLFSGLVTACIVSVVVTAFIYRLVSELRITETLLAENPCIWKKRFVLTKWRSSTWPRRPTTMH
jgi:hypothetical protein